MATEGEALKNLQGEAPKEVPNEGEALEEKVVEAAAVLKKEVEASEEHVNETATFSGKEDEAPRQDVNEAATFSGKEDEAPRQDVNEAATFSGKEDEAPRRDVNEATDVPEKVVLKTLDGEEFELDSEVARQSGTIKNMIEDGYASNGVPLPNVTGPVLAKVIQYWKSHATADGDAEVIKNFDKEFMQVEDDEMFEILMAANYLDTKPLLDLACQAVADTIKDMSVEDVRDYFGIVNDYMAEEEAKMREEYGWAFTV